MRFAYVLFALFSLKCLASESPVSMNLFAWASAGFDVSFPQTYVLDKKHGVTYGKLAFDSETDYLKSWEAGKNEGHFELNKVKNNFPELYSRILAAWNENDKVIVTVSVDKTIADCEPCTLQNGLLDEKNYFGLPHVEVALSK